MFNGYVYFPTVFLRIDTDYACRYKEIHPRSEKHNHTGTEAVALRCSVRKVFLEICQNPLENTCARNSFLIKLHAQALLKKSLWHRCFPVNFAKFLRTPFFTEHLRWLLLSRKCSVKKMFLKISQNLQGKHSWVWRSATHRCFPKNFAKCLRTIPYL